MGFQPQPGPTWTHGLVVIS